LLLAQDRRGRITRRSLERMLLTAFLRPEESGRQFVVLSLAEAETLRRVMHLRRKEIREVSPTTSAGSS
jgi:hypothetical protein